MSAKLVQGYEVVIGTALMLVGENSRTVARAVGAKIDAACRDRGFFYVTGHGVDPALSGAVFDATRRFFALDQTEKDRVHLRNSKIRRGYEGIGFQTLDPGKPADLKQHQTCFACHAERVKDRDYVFTRFAP